VNSLGGYITESNVFSLYKHRE